jgi:periplasmic divalent cation tolerance protein
MREEALVVFSTFPDLETARRVVRTLVEEHLVACGNLIPHVESIYSWKGTVEMSEEILVVFKTEIARYQALEERLRSMHPYDVPECVALRVAEGLPDYLRWITESVIPNEGA